MIRGEYLFRGSGYYPTSKEGRENLHDYLELIARKTVGGEIWYRTTDFDYREASVLSGVEDELAEFRGIRRGLRFPELLECELSIVSSVQSQYPHLNVMFPFVSQPREVETALRIASGVGVGGHFGIMLETPAVALCLEDFLLSDVGRVIVGLNDLHALTMGITRGAGIKPSWEKSVERLVSMAREITRRHGVRLSMAGYLDSQLMDMASRLSVDDVVLHYSQLPVLLGDSYLSLPDLEVLSITKKRSRDAIKAKVS